MITGSPGQTLFVSNKETLELLKPEEGEVYNRIVTGLETILCNLLKDCVRQGQEGVSRDPRKQVELGIREEISLE